MKTKEKLAKARAILNNQQATSTELEKALRDIVDELENADPWWVIALKTLAYLIGLLLAGFGTTAAAQTLIFH